MYSERIGFYSIGPDGKYSSDMFQLKYIRTVSKDELPFDLNAGLVKRAQYYRTEFNIFVKYLEKADLLDRYTQKLPFVCTYALHTLSEQGTLHITACLYRNAIYLRAEEVNFPFSSSNIETSETTSSWNLKFLQFMQSDLPGGKRDTEKLAYGIEQFHIVCESTINCNTVIHSESVCGVEGKGECLFKETDDKTEILRKLKKIDIVNCGTTKYLKNERQQKMYNIFTTKKFWINAKLLGVKKIFIGHRDADGILKTIEKTTPSLMIEAGKEYWNAEKSIQQIDDILTKIKFAFTNKALNQNPNNICTLFFKKTTKTFFEVPENEAGDFPKISFA